MAFVLMVVPLQTAMATLLKIIWYMVFEQGILIIFRNCSIGCSVYIFKIFFFNQIHTGEADVLCGGAKFLEP